MNLNNYIKKPTFSADITSTAFEEYQAAEACLHDLNVLGMGTFLNRSHGFRLEANIPMVEQDFSVSLKPLAINDLLSNYRYGIPKGLGQIPSFKTSADVIPFTFRYVPSYVPDLMLEDGELAGLISAIDELTMNCSEPNWDGYEAKPILRSVRDEAVRLIKMLPIDLPLPEASPEPMGTVAFEWYKAKDYLFIASVAGRGIVEYAGLYGIGNSDYGTARIEHAFPKTIAYHIRRLFED